MFGSSKKKRKTSLKARVNKAEAKVRKMEEKQSLLARLEKAKKKLAR